MSTVPVFAPSGDLGDIPTQRVNDALKAGFKVGVHVKSADGQDGVIPANRTADAVKAGMTVVPISEQPIQHEGFWSALGGDLLGMMKSGAPPTTKEGLLQKVKMFKEAVTGPDPREYLQNAVDRMNAGRNPAYAAAAGAGEQLGVNVKGMEQSAQQGDVGGVAGHAAAVPAVMGAGTVLGELPLGRMTKAAGGALQGGAERLPIVGPVAKGAIRGAVKSWRASAPDVEIPASKVSTTPPESVTKSSQLQQSRALQNIPVRAVQDKSTILSRLQQIAQQPGTGISAPEYYGRDLRIAGQPVSASADLTSALKQSLPSKSGKLVASRGPAIQGEVLPKGQPEAGSTESVIPPVDAETGANDYVKPVTSKETGKPMYEAFVRENGKDITLGEYTSRAVAQKYIDSFRGRDVPGPKAPQVIEGQTSLPQSRIQGKIMQVLRREGTLGMDRLMEAPELQGLSREQVEKAAMSLGNSKKLWVPTKEADAHGPAGIISLAIRKP